MQGAALIYFLRGVLGGLIPTAPILVACHLSWLLWPASRPVLTSEIFAFVYAVAGVIVLLTIAAHLVAGAMRVARPGHDGAASLDDIETRWNVLAAWRGGRKYFESRAHAFVYIFVIVGLVLMVLISAGVTPVWKVAVLMTVVFALQGLLVLLHDGILTRLKRQRGASLRRVNQQPSEG